VSEEGEEPPADNSAESDERVGYRRPPLGTRFRPGQSGNPLGRPKGARNLSTVVAAALGERVAVTENGRRRRISKLEATVKQLVNRAASGETRAMQLLLALAAANEARSAQSDPERLGEADAIVIAELTRRLGRDAQ
jgi:Family of unknown function (DUF5681)